MAEKSNLFTTYREKRCYLLSLYFSIKRINSCYGLNAESINEVLVLVIDVLGVVFVPPVIGPVVPDGVISEEVLQAKINSPKQKLNRTTLCNGRK